MVERTGASENGKYPRKNLFLGAGVVALFVSVPAGLLLLGVGTYQRIVSKKE